MNPKILKPDEVKEPGYYWHLLQRWVDNTGYVRYSDKWGIVEVSESCGGGFEMRLFNGLECDLEGEFIGPLEPPEV